MVPFFLTRNPAGPCWPLLAPSFDSRRRLSFSSSFCRRRLTPCLAVSFPAIHCPCALITPHSDDISPGSGFGNNECRYQKRRVAPVASWDGPAVMCLVYEQVPEWPPGRDTSFLSSSRDFSAAASQTSTFLASSWSSRHRQSAPAFRLPLSEGCRSRHSGWALPPSREGSPTLELSPTRFAFHALFCHKLKEAFQMGKYSECNEHYLSAPVLLD